MNNLHLIIVREYLARIRNKSFVIMTFLSPIIMVAMVLLIIYLSNLNNRGKSVVAIHDNTGQLIEKFNSDDNITYKDLSQLSLGEAIDSAERRDYTGLLAIPNDGNVSALKDNIQFFANSSPKSTLISSIEETLSKVLTNRQLIKKNFDVTEIKAAETQVHLTLENYSGQHTSKMGTYIKMIFGGAAGYLLMMFIIIYGNMVMRSVIEEKTNRIIEIIISSVKPIQLMMGKILGSTFAGITQFLIWAVFGTILLLVASSFFDVSLTHAQQLSASGFDFGSEAFLQNILISIVSLPLLKLIFCFLIYFIAGYFLYSSIYAAIGAAVDSETDTQQFIFPVLVPLMLAIYVGFFSVIGNPDGIVPVIFSYIPLTSPIVMLMRIPFGVPWWEIIISMSILIVSVLAMMWLGAKIYRIGILMYGKKPSYKQIGKWLKY